jgi:hypothetical protein
MIKNMIYIVACLLCFKSCFTAQRGYLHPNHSPQQFAIPQAEKLYNQVLQKANYNTACTYFKRFIKKFEHHYDNQIIYTMLITMLQHLENLLDTLDDSEILTDELLQLLDNPTQP